MTRRPLSMAFAATLLCVLVHTDLQAQAVGATHDFRTTRLLGGGLVVNAPDIIPGGHVLLLFGNGWGVFAEGRASYNHPGRDPYYLPDIDREMAETIFGDPLQHTEDAWLNANVGLVRALTGEMAAYAGVGVAQRTRYREYFDSSGQRGRLGYYWVRSDEESGAVLNTAGGMLFQLGNRILVNLGAELRPAGALIGFTWSGRI
jgi:hypothetical protein